MGDKGDCINGVVNLYEDLMVNYRFCYSILSVIICFRGVEPPAPPVHPPLVVKYITRQQYQCIFSHPNWICHVRPIQGLINRPVRSNRRGPVPVYRTGLVGNRWKLVKFKFKFKFACSTGSDRLTGRFDW